jgi:hypothetical protein
MTVDRTQSGMPGVTAGDVVGNLVTALVSNEMIRPNYSINPATGIDCLLSVQYRAAKLYW